MSQTKVRNIGFVALNAKSTFYFLNINHTELNGLQSRKTIKNNKPRTRTTNYLSDYF